MDLFLQDIYTAIFTRIIELNARYTFKETHQHEHLTLVYEDKYMKSQITFYHENIIEFDLYNNTKEKNVFFLHFQMTQLAHAVKLLNELFDSMDNIEANNSLKVLLSCSSGMTTSLFAYELTNGAQAISLDYSFDAVGYNQLLGKGNDYDVILLAPQISYKHAEVESAFHHKLIIDMPTTIFGSLNVGDMLQLLREELYKYKLRDRAPLDLKIQKNFNNNNTVLCIGIVRHSDEIRLGYRIYHHKQILLDNEVIKHQISTQDMSDIIRTVIVNYHIDKIGIAIPGIINNGTSRSSDGGIDNIDLIRLFEYQYHIPVTVINDVNAMSVGHYMTQNESENISFIFQPRGRVIAGCGNIINGQLNYGYAGLSGELQFLRKHKTRLLDDSVDILDIVSENIIAIMITCAPNLIIYYCDLIPDAELVKRKIAQTVPMEYIPEIRKTIHLKDYMLLGTMVICETN